MVGSTDFDFNQFMVLDSPFDFVQYSDAAHELEHCLEVQLPFLQVLLADFQILPLAVGGAHPTQIEALLDHLWGGEETLIVISSDLSHYHDYATARGLDGQTSRWIETFNPAKITGDHACGQIPIRGLLRAAVKHGLRCEILDLRNSGDTAGPRDRVVGYGAYVFYDGDDGGPTPGAERRRLTELARRSIDHGLAHGRALAVALHDWPPQLRAERATFVTLHKYASLRGCIGSLAARRPMVEDIAENAYAAAFRDPRFAALTEDELPSLDIHIAVLSPPEALDFRSAAELMDQIRPGIDGLILSEGEHRGTFLPSVWEQVPERHAFLRHLKRKAGLPEDYWSDTLSVSRYTTESW